MMSWRQFARRIAGHALPDNRLLLRGSLQRAAVLPDNDVVPVSLTFDDGPHPVHTRDVLDALDAAGWTGTFFVVGREAAAHPELIREIVERGHEIGNHTYTHGEPQSTSVRELIEEVHQTQQLLEALTGQAVRVMRPPRGKLSFSKARALWQADQSIVLWNVDPRDFAMPDVNAARQWAEHYAPTSGDIVLLHDRLPRAAEIISTLTQTSGNRAVSVGLSWWLRSEVRQPQSAWVRAAESLLC